MPTLAVSLFEIALAVHIAAVVIGFGVTFAYPVFYGYGRRLDPRAMPWFHRVAERIGKTVISPGLLVVVLVGIYLTSHLHQWSAFYVQWGMGAAIVLGALGGAYFSPRERRLAELATRDVAAAGPEGDVRFSAEYERLFRQISIVGMLSSLLVLVTIFLMSVQAGA
ncbi:MAG TPA: DUF2269 family protein [Solirubrobacteraceae bacterium]|jgi:uncharacterized membrane protein|nr:DUF2269 family protein [Solirubrobacteraceae bacterium]